MFKQNMVYATVALINYLLVRNLDAKPYEFYVEILLVTDFSVYQMHENILSAKKWNKNSSNNPDLIINHIKTYYTEVIDQVNQRFETSFSQDPYLQIKILISQFYISEKPEDSVWSERSGQKKDHYLNGDLSLIEFNAWLEDNRENFLEFDHAFGVTAMDLVSDDSNLDYNGLGYIYGICKKLFSGSLIEDKGAFESVRSFAHELAHNLGTDHDGITGSGECSEWDNYIMAPKFFPYNQMNSWKFSNCSISKIKEFLSDSANNHCLWNEPKAKEIASGFEILPGQVYNLFDQCKALHGSNSTPCFEYESLFCQSLFCRVNQYADECIWIAPASEGSDCGDNKWCIQGSCEPKDIEEKLRLKKSQISNCMDLMDDRFCDAILINNYCDEKFYWHGKSIGRNWCKKKCKNC